MRILGIESSCDETAIALVVKDGDRFVIEKSSLASQVKIHAAYGGVVPEVAAREHADNIFPLLNEAGVSAIGEGIDAIAVTSGPGLVPALRVGVELGKCLAWAWKKPLVAVNHLEGHIYSVWVGNDENGEDGREGEEGGNGRRPCFPTLCLIVSGGHTELILMTAHGKYELIGMTRDDAAGEAFDKVAKLLGLAYPGGPEISRIALQGDPAAVDFPRPMIDSPNFDFSFSGLKTAVRREMIERAKMSKRAKMNDIAASFQQAVVDVLVAKTMRAVDVYHPRSVILSGGVAANKLLRQTLAADVQKITPSVSFHAPDLSLTGDNAVMIAMAGAFRFEAGDVANPLTLVADPNMRLAGAVSSR